MDRYSCQHIVFALHIKRKQTCQSCLSLHNYEVYMCYISGKVQVKLPQTALTLTSDLLKKRITLPALFKLGCQHISPLVER